MEPYKARKMPFDYTPSNEISALLFEAREIYGEYKGYLRNMQFDYKCFLEAEYSLELYNSFKIDGAKIDKDNTYFMPYMVKNNISSIYAAREILGSADCFICESDLYVADASIFQKELKHSCYFGRMQQGYSEDWVFEREGEFITRVGKGGSDTYNMVGVSYFKQKDAKILRTEIEKAYAVPEKSDWFWDDVVNQNLDKLHLTIEPVEAGQLIEIDTVEELNRINESL